MTLILPFFVCLGLISYSLSSCVRTLTVLITNFLSMDYWIPNHDLLYFPGYCMTIQRLRHRLFLLDSTTLAITIQLHIWVQLDMHSRQHNIGIHPTLPFNATPFTLTGRATMPLSPCRFMCNIKLRREPRDEHACKTMSVGRPRSSAVVPKPGEGGNI